MWGRFVDVFRRRRLDADLESQLAHHLTAREAELSGPWTRARRCARSRASRVPAARAALAEPMRILREE